MASVRQRLREALGSGAFRRYLLVRATSQGGDGLFQQAAVAVLLIENPSANPALDLLRVTAIALVPYTLIAPFTGVAIDRFERRKIIVWTPLLRAAAAVFAFAVAGNDALFLVAVVAVLSLNRFYLATLATVLPQLVPEDDLVVANSASSTAGAVANVTGQAAGTLVAEWLTGRIAALLAAVGFFLSGRLGRDLPVRRGLDEPPAPLRDEVARVVREMREGAVETVRAPRVRRGMTAITLLQFFAGMLVAILFHFLIGELGLGPSSAFAMLAVLAVGVGAGVVVVPWLSERVGLAATIRIAFVIAAGGTMLPTGTLNRGLMALAAGLVGVAYSLVKVPVDTIVQEDIPDEIRGRVFSLYDLLFNGARIAGTAVAALAYEAGAGTRTQMVVTTCGFLVVGLWLRIPPRGPHREPLAEPLNLPPQPPVTGPGLAPQIGTLVRLVAEPGGRAEEEPAALVSGEERHAIVMLWRGRAAAGGVERRVLGLATSRYGMRVVADEDTGAWEVTATWRR